MTCGSCATKVTGAVRAAITDAGLGTATPSSPAPALAIDVYQSGN